MHSCIDSTRAIIIQENTDISNLHSAILYARSNNEKTCQKKKKKRMVAVAFGLDENCNRVVLIPRQGCTVTTRLLPRRGIAQVRTYSHLQPPSGRQTPNKGPPCPRTSCTCPVPLIINKKIIKKKINPPQEKTFLLIQKQMHMQWDEFPRKWATARLSLSIKKKKPVRTRGP